MRHFGIRVSANVALYEGFVSNSDPEISLKWEESHSTTCELNASELPKELAYKVPGEGCIDVGSEFATLHADRSMDVGRAAELLGGPGFGLAAFLRGYAVLHGSAVAADGYAVSFVGPSGVGKSTLSAAAVRSGATFCSDGMTLVDMGTVTCRAGPNRWKLRADSVSSLKQSIGALERVSVGSAKWFLDAPAATEKMLRDVLILEQGEGPRIEWLSPAEGALQLMVHGYSAHVLLDTHTRQLFERMTKLANKIRVGRFVRPLGWEHLANVGDWIVSNL